MTFYLVFKHQRKVEFCRRQPGIGNETYLSYLGYANGKLVHFSMSSCEASVGQTNLPTAAEATRCFSYVGVVGWLSLRQYPTKDYERSGRW
ncbi:TPA: hypothetical protein N0F65_010430 [Lagenidium giganteum]|uniref:Uncharacterized protein n=1 Tax=Lagenidium giganteum TaxID=4803 RepID=A0AAV2YV81_9STRA|nr:TPA: hypothetical protein N0F65_010430 [Lagenidium giganteum]